jgi:hypothetical protein
VATIWLKGWTDKEVVLTARLVFNTFNSGGSGGGGGGGGSDGPVAAVMPCHPAIILATGLRWRCLSGTFCLLFSSRRWP